MGTNRCTGISTVFNIRQKKFGINVKCKLFTVTFFKTENIIQNPCNRGTIIDSLNRKCNLDCIKSICTYVRTGFHYLVTNTTLMKDYTLRKLNIKEKNQCFLNNSNNLSVVKKRFTLWMLFEVELNTCRYFFVFLLLQCNFESIIKFEGDGQWKPCKTSRVVRISKS